MKPYGRGVHLRLDFAAGEEIGGVANGTLLAYNDNWQDNPSQAAQIQAHHLAPPHPTESAIFRAVAPAGYIALVPRQPWFVESANAHGNGQLIIFTDGSIVESDTLILTGSPSKSASP